MIDAAHQIVQRIHDSPTQVVLALAGGGTGALAALLEAPGASRTLLEAVIPYSDPAMAAWLGSRPDQSCSPRTARAMAVVAFGRARKYGAPDTPIAGISCTASLASDRPKRGPHRAHVAVQTAARTATWSLELAKGRRTRPVEEQLASRLVLNAIADASGLEPRLDLPLMDGEGVEHLETLAPQPWQDLFLGTIDLVRHDGPDHPKSCETEPPPAVVMPGAFNPLHPGHRGMAQVAGEILGQPVALEMSVLNVDKPPLDYFEIDRRTRQFGADQPVWLTRAATFEEKSRLFPGATFVVGVDTLRRIAEPQYYGDQSACLRALERITRRGCRFLVFCRHMGAGLVRPGDLDLPDVLRRICQEVPSERFREDVSSTAIRQSGEW